MCTDTNTHARMHAACTHTHTYTQTRHAETQHSPQHADPARRGRAIRTPRLKPPAPPPPPPPPPPQLSSLMGARPAAGSACAPHFGQYAKESSSGPPQHAHTPPAHARTHTHTCMHPHARRARTPTLPSGSAAASGRGARCCGVSPVPAQMWAGGEPQKSGEREEAGAPATQRRRVRAQNGARTRHADRPRAGRAGRARGVLLWHRPERR